MKKNPSDWRIDEVENIAKRFGVTARRSGESHVVFTHPNWIEQLCIPAHKPIKPIYIKRLLVLLDTLEEGKDE